ncbi:MAG: GDP-fucose synthetase [Bacteroidetes bacterium GWF2_43_63]|nr:MAG: GDP-fucose synthetase [Bacteroidetes bacterium GWE2_42_42]OFY55548.1 MAG: GDP-fucose synthetase [Bacteroidetes bacterium GWF2_43_63]HBG71560.1 GDP-fucose synthetase [Bacteroidales bacterium]HCB62093.1 GDP-fucose synthetase [Bacteroidales bacterium]HCY22321.1 GDP-fucose synthetase [Bacteroidales bacterium]
MEFNEKIYVAGHTGLVGSAIVRSLQNHGFNNIISRDISELDLRNQQAVNDFFASEKPVYVILAAAKVGGIHANNTYPAEFIYDNMMIEFNVVHAAYKNQVKKLLFLGSSCIYPKLAPQPISEDSLLTGSLEPTNEAYAIAKISGLELCKFYRRQYGCDFISAMPTNLYGINDNFDLNTSHVLPAMIRKFHEAKIENKPEVVLWGTGKPLREFLYVDDLADALVHLMQNYSEEIHVNIGTGEDLSINELALTIKSVVGYEGQMVYDTTKPDGTPRKLLDVSRLHASGWKHTTSLREGIEKVYQWYLSK